MSVVEVILFRAAEIRDKSLDYPFDHKLVQTQTAFQKNNAQSSVLVTECWSIEVWFG